VKELSFLDAAATLLPDILAALFKLEKTDFNFPPEHDFTESSEKSLGSLQHCDSFYNTHKNNYALSNI